MPHYYVSIPPDHKVFKYAGYRPSLNADYYQKSFEEYGPTGVPGGEPGPYIVMTWDEYKGDKIDLSGEPQGKQPYTPKQLILTKREGAKIWRVMWSQRSSPDEEIQGREYALREGWMLHAFKVGDQRAWDEALKQHEDIEGARIA